MEAPLKVKTVPRLKEDLRALSALTVCEEPPLRLMRLTFVRSVRYGFGGASRSEFGSTVTAPEDILYRHGVWGWTVWEGSSNRRELTNLVETLEWEAAQGRLHGCEVFLFTDNSMSEAAFIKGTSSSLLLFNLVLRLRILKVELHCMLHVVHVAGTRVIGQGSDGPSRGDLTEDVTTGRLMISYVPLSQSALERSDNLESWLRSWAGTNLQVLTPTGWFLKGQGITGFARDESGQLIPTYETGTLL